MFSFLKKKPDSFQKFIEDSDKKLLTRFKVYLNDGSCLEFYAHSYRDNKTNNTIEFIITKVDYTNPILPLYIEKIGEINRSLVKYIQGEDDEN